MNNEIFDLNPKQKEAFKRLQKAYKDCEKLKVLFVNNYGTLEAYDSKYIANYVGDNERKDYDDKYLIETRGTPAFNYINSVDSWADDNHFIVMTEKGLNLYNDEE